MGPELVLPLGLFLTTPSVLARISISVVLELGLSVSEVSFFFFLSFFLRFSPISAVTIMLENASCGDPE